MARYAPAHQPQGVAEFFPECTTPSNAWPSSRDYLLAWTATESVLFLSHGRHKAFLGSSVFYFLSLGVLWTRVRRGFGGTGRGS